MEAVTREPNAYAGNNPINNTDPLGLFCVGSLCTPDVVGDTLGGAWDATGGRAVTWADEHRDGIAAGMSIVGGVACAAASGGVATSACVAVSLAGLSLSYYDATQDDDLGDFYLDLGIEAVGGLLGLGAVDEVFDIVANACTTATSTLLDGLEATR